MDGAVRARVLPRPLAKPWLQAERMPGLANAEEQSSLKRSNKLIVTSIGVSTSQESRDSTDAPNGGPLPLPMSSRPRDRPSPGCEVRSSPQHDLGLLFRGDHRRKTRAWRHFTTQNGLVKGTCQTIAITKSGDAWVGYSVAGAVTLVKNAYTASRPFRTFRSDNSTGNMHVQFMDVDKRGWLWLGTDSGDFVATPEDADWLRLAPFAGPGNRGLDLKRLFRHFGVALGCSATGTDRD